MEEKKDAEHGSAFSNIYVNDIGKDSMRGAKPSFPQGSIIVKEKISGKSRSVPELLTVMVKREKGFNPESADWEYMVLEGDAATIRLREKTGTCFACHSKQKNDDYVFRSYLLRNAQAK